jgi:two-component system chemotaxis sensor kinase CheA
LSEILRAARHSSEKERIFSQSPALRQRYKALMHWLRQQIEQEEMVQRMHAEIQAPPLGELLIAQGLISRPILRELMEKKTEDERLGETLVRSGQLSMAQLQATLDLQQRFKRRTHGTFSLDNRQMLELRNWIGEMGAMINLLQQQIAPPPEENASPKFSLYTATERDLASSEEALSHENPILSRVRELHTHLSQRVHSLSMIPLSQLFDRLRPQIQEIAHRLGHLVQIETEGGLCEVELYQVASVEAILRGLARNAIEHGIEPPSHRESIGKEARGMLRLRAHIERRRADAHRRFLVLTIEDDGRGLQRERILEEATRQGLLQPQEIVDDKRILHLFLEQRLAQGDRSLSSGNGFVQIAQHLKLLDAKMAYSPREGGGCVFRIHLPIPTTFLFGKHFSRHGQHFFVPSGAIRESIPAQEAVTVYHPSGKLAIQWYDEPLIGIARLPSLQLPQRPDTPSQGFVPPPSAVFERPEGGSSYLLLESVEGLIALYVDTLYPDQMAELVFVGSSYLKDPCIGGGAILQNGAYAWVIDPNQLYQQHHLPK